MKDIDLMAVRDFARTKHGTQKRKYTGEPYINHPMSVANMLLDLEAPKAVVAAAILHDVLEDTDATAEEVEAISCQQTLDLVLQVTDVSTAVHGNRIARKALDREHLAKSTYWGASIKLADMIDNSRTIVKYDKGFATLYLHEKAALLTVLGHGHPTLRRWATDILDLSNQIIAGQRMS